MCNIESENNSNKGVSMDGRLVFCSNEFAQRLEERALNDKSFTVLYNAITCPDKITSESVRLWLKGENTPGLDKCDVIRMVLGISNKRWWTNEGSIFRIKSRLAS